MIDLRITDAARKKIAATLLSESERSALAALVWKGGTEGYDGTWVVGFYARSKIPPGDVEIVDGVEFVIAGPPLHVPLLQGKRLDFVGEQFVVVAK